MLTKTEKKPVDILYVFGGEKAQGAEIVIERLMSHNLQEVRPHLFISPGIFSQMLIKDNKPYSITLISHLKKLNRSSTGSLKFYSTAIKNYTAVSYKVYRYIKKNKIKIIHANTVVPASYLLPLIFLSYIFLSKTKWLWSDHDIKYYSKLDHLLSRLCAKLYSNTLVVSEAVKKKYPSNKKALVLYNGLDVDIFNLNYSIRKILRNELKIESDALVLGMPAVIEPRKGQLELIKIFKELYKSFSNIYLLFAGRFAVHSPQYSKQFEHAIKDHNKIIYLGFVNNTIDFYNACDIIISNTSDVGSEPLGTTIYEAMACQKIVIASDTGGGREIIDDAVDGFLFEPDNAQALSEKLKFTLMNYSSLNEMKLSARKKVETKFNLVLMVNQYNAIIKSQNLH